MLSTGLQKRERPIDHDELLYTSTLANFKLFNRGGAYKADTIPIFGVGGPWSTMGRERAHLRVR